MKQHSMDRGLNLHQRIAGLLTIMAGLLVLLCSPLSLAAGLANPPPAQMTRLSKLTLAGPYAAVSWPLIHMAESGALSEIADKVEFVAWKTPDQLRVLALDSKNPADFIAMPSNVAANLYNRKVPLQLINVSTWGVLWLISRDPQLKTLADFKGKEILMPFRADMPDIVFSLLAERAGLDAKKNFKLRYVASPLDAMQLLIARQADHALLAEPAASMALRKTHSFPVNLVAPELYRSVDLQNEWGRLLHREARIPQAGVVAMGRMLDKPAVIERVQQAYAKSLAWCEAHADECGTLAAKHIPMLSAAALADSIRVDRTAFVDAQQARPELEFFFEQLRTRQPALIGGKLPDDGFYWSEK